MSRSQITFTLGQGTIANPATGTDYISGIQFYYQSGLTTAAPGSFAATACQPVFSLSDAENKGITNDYGDETQATAIITLALGTPGTGDQINIQVKEKLPNGATNMVNIGTYTVASTDTTSAILATSVASYINSQSYLTASTGMAGYTANTLSSPDVVTLVARVGLGINLNGIYPTVTVTSTSSHPTTAVPGEFAGGVYSQRAIWNYHVSEFFRANPTSELWVQFSATPSGSFTELTSLQTAAAGACMRIGVYSFAQRNTSQVVSDLQAMQSIANSLFTAYQPAAIFYAPNISQISSVSSLTNLQTINPAAESCYCIISQDGAAAGAQLFVNSGVSISNIGCILGTSSAASVSQDIGEIGAFNLSNGVEMNVPAFSTGTLVSSVPGSLLDTLDDFRYGFCVNMTGYSGTFVNNDWTAVANTNAYNRLGRVLTIYKVERQQYIALLPLLKSRIYLNADGTMTQTTIEQYTGAAEPRIMQMVNDGDLSPGNITGGGLTKGVVNIDPTQNVNSQGYVSIVYNLLGVDIADNINVTLQFTQKLA